MTCERGVFSNDDVINVDVIIGVNMSMCYKDFISVMKYYVNTKICEQHFLLHWMNKNKLIPKQSCISIVNSKIVLL